MNLVKWSPFRDMEDLFDRYARITGGPLTNKGLELLKSDVEWRPVADITENDKEYVIKADLPEVKRDDVDVSIEDGLLTITGERRMEERSEEDKQHRIEAFYGRFSRSFSIPEDVDASRISATSKDGVLRVKLPKTKVKKKEPQRIDVK